MVWRGLTEEGRSDEVRNGELGSYDIIFMKKLLTKRKRYAKMVVTSERRVGFSKYLVGRKRRKLCQERRLVA